MIYQFIHDKHIQRHYPRLGTWLIGSHDVAEAAAGRREEQDQGVEGSAGYAAGNQSGAATSDFHSSVV